MKENKQMQKDLKMLCGVLRDNCIFLNYLIDKYNIEDIDDLYIIDGLLTSIGNARDNVKKSFKNYKKSIKEGNIQN